MKFFLLCAALLFVQYSFAIPEKNFEATYNAEVLPFYNAQPSQYWTNAQGMKIHFKKFINPTSTKTIVMLPGRTDAVVRYAENIFDLYHMGYSVYVMDEQGQGQSDRLLEDTSKGYVKNFDDYINDFDGWLKAHVLNENRHQELFFVGHSMGGAIGTLYIHAHPETFSKMVILAPMFEIRMGSNTRYNMAFRAVQRAVNNGYGASYIPGAGPFRADHYQFPNNIYTHSKERFDMSKVVFLKNPEIQLGGATYKWALESLKAGWKFYDIGSEMRTPAILIQGEYDSVVYGGVQAEFCKEHPDCKLKVAKASNHDILSEKDTIRDDVLKTIKEFF